MFYPILFIFTDACTLRLFGKILSFSNSHFSTNFRRIFDRFTFDELSFDVISTNGRVRLNVVFDDMSHSTKGFSTKSHGREISINVVCATSKASDQRAHTRSLIRAFACRLNIL